MVVLLWDASALAKRYAPEMGSDTVDALFAAVPTTQMVSSSVSYAEIYSILLRKFNRATIDRVAFDTAKSSLRAELINDPDFVLLSIDDTAFYSGIALMEAHNLNATDAALLILFQSYIQTFAPDSGMTFLLVAADDRLVRTARTEGLQAISPETLPAADVPAFLAALSAP
jgi:predicted nucleic acid-binding protein